MSGGAHNRAGQAIPGHAPTGSETDRPTASPGNRSPLPLPSEALRQPVRSYFGMSRPATDRTATPLPASHEPACSADTPHAPAAETPHSISSDAVARRVRLEQRRQSRRHDLAATRSTPLTWRPRSVRAAFELLVRKAMRPAPRPVRQLVEHIYPRFSPDYVMPLDDFIRGLPPRNSRGRP